VNLFPRDIHNKLKETFVENKVEVHWSVLVNDEGRVSPPTIMVSVSKQPNGWVHTWSKPEAPLTIEQIIDDLKRQLTFWKELGEPRMVKPSRPLIQVELEALIDERPNLFEVTLRGMLEEQLGANRATVERVNRYLSMSRAKMYLLLEGIGCSKERIEQLRQLDL